MPDTSMLKEYTEGKEPDGKHVLAFQFFRDKVPSPLPLYVHYDEEKDQYTVEHASARSVRDGGTDTIVPQDGDWIVYDKYNRFFGKPRIYLAQAFQDLYLTKNKEEEAETFPDFYDGQWHWFVSKQPQENENNITHCRAYESGGMWYVRRFLGAFWSTNILELPEEVFWQRYTPLNSEQIANTELLYPVIVATVHNLEDKFFEALYQPDKPKPWWRFW